MHKWLPIFGIGFIIFAFSFFILSLLNIVPKIIGIPLLFLSILFTVSSVNNRHRFRGFDN